MARDYKPLESKFHRIRNSFRSVVRRGPKHKSHKSVDSPTHKSEKSTGSIHDSGSNSERQSNDRRLSLFGSKGRKVNM